MLGWAQVGEIPALRGLRRVVQSEEPYREYRSGEEFAWISLFHSVASEMFQLVNFVPQELLGASAVDTATKIESTFPRSPPDGAIHATRMATLIPSLNTCLPRMQAGEKRFARRLETHLEDDYLCWYELPVGRRQRHSDFILLHPARGLLLLEVKDWRLDSLRRVDKV